LLLSAACAILIKYGDIMSENSAFASLPERKIPDEQVEKYREFYIDLLGFVPPRIQARTDLLARVDPELLAKQEELRRLCMYPDCFDTRTSQRLRYCSQIAGRGETSCFGRLSSGATPRAECRNQSGIPVWQPFNANLGTGSAGHRQVIQGIVKSICYKPYKIGELLALFDQNHPNGVREAASGRDHEVKHPRPDGITCQVRFLNKSE
jgi:hypothetical protein